MLVMGPSVPIFYPFNRPSPYPFPRTQRANTKRLEWRSLKKVEKYQKTRPIHSSTGRPAHSITCLCSKDANGCSVLQFLQANEYCVAKTVENGPCIHQLLLMRRAVTPAVRSQGKDVLNTHIPSLCLVALSILLNCSFPKPDPMA